MKRFSTKNRPLSAEQIERLERLAAMPDDMIDYSDIPEMTAEEWGRAIRPAYVLNAGKKPA